ncbi:MULTISPECIES: DUF6864 domain-containing function [Vibrio]|uniref:DUF6864 domain-containing function n=1 Tax=Vibrio TaxID=662 RepID=UPI00038E31FA|nr:hypothetical protein [Vibrio parahaemolyticus]ANQ55811.1 hypothetical protein AB831_06365 [Vibrio parahaemolyticus]ASO15672.1 hypothetical protein BGM07_015485 [Vibrio parahaemolyticus]EGQ7714837.1 hypothetical protein [Vibrio parahaemolyticus]EGQ7720880.1 hypothetical protein [Vibrio parahaemolyticus]EGQ7723895.1 hypothetical protein [Vibrio parahaemolyticus]
MVSVGGLEVVFNQTLLVLEGEGAFIEFKAKNWDVKVKVIVSKDDSSSDSRYKFYGDSEEGEEFGVIELINWKDSVGMGLDEKVRFGETEGQNLYLLVCGQKIGNVHKLDLQFSLGGVE